MRSLFVGLIAGAIGYACVLKLPAVDAAESKEKVVYSFCSQKYCADGDNPVGGLIDVKGKLYGTTYYGGSPVSVTSSGRSCAEGFPGCGVVFSVDLSTGAEAVIHSFGNGMDGELPWASLLDVKGTLYGTTYEGGSHGAGVVFSLDPDTGVEKLLHTFCVGCTDGALPVGSLIDVSGILYGTTRAGGTGTCDNFLGSGCGAVFALDLDTGVESVVYSFQNNETDGQNPFANLIAMKGILYGTTYWGGFGGGGTVFAVNLNTGAETVVYSFCSQNNCTDGDTPYAGLIDVNGILYGTTTQGGTGNCADDCGTVFSVDPNTGAETVLYSFCSRHDCIDGAFPRASLIDVNGTLYGTTFRGGAYGAGTVFALNLATGTEKVIHSFGGDADGGSPYAGLISVKGKLYGTTGVGGAHCCGTVFSLKIP